MNRNKIFYIASRIALCGVLTAAVGTTGCGKKNELNNDSKPDSSGAADLITISETEISTLTTEAPTEIIVSSGNDNKYFNKLGLPDIDPEKDTDEEIIEAVRKYVTAADEYSFESMFPNGYPDCYGQGNDINVSDSYITVDDLVNRGDIIYDEDEAFYAFLGDTLTLDNVKEDVLSVYSTDYKLLDKIFDGFREKNGKLYHTWMGGDFAGFYDFSDSRIEIKSKDENKIVADVYMDFTDHIKPFYYGSGFSDYYGYYVPEEMMYLFGDDYKYEYPMQITLIREDGGWRISEYTNRNAIMWQAKEACPEYQAVIEYNNKNEAALEEALTDELTLIEYSDFVGTWTVDDNTNGYELCITVIEDGVVTFKLSKYRTFVTGLLTGTIDNSDHTGRLVKLNTYGSEDGTGLKGHIYFCDDDSISLSITEINYPNSEPIELIFNTKN
ncbi:MAG: hypothetical protein IKK47_04335 [Ruminococcus sp.]|nr:hypothetical protein [Ruminococcus sp.]